MNVTDIFTIPLEADRHIVYAPLQKCAFIGNTAMVDRLAKLRRGVPPARSAGDDTLLEFLRRIEVIACKEDSFPNVNQEGPPIPASVTLLLTTACNLRCLYCYASSGDRTPNYMSLATAKHAIDFIVSNAVENELKEIQVNYHGGGEPTVHWGVLTKSYEYAKIQAERNKLKLKGSVATNGVLASEHVDWMVTNLDSCSISIDGSPDIHDLYRVKIGGQGSCDDVVATMNRLDKSKYRYAVRMTVASDAISSLAESVSFVCENFHPSRIQIEPAYTLGRWENEPSSETEEFVENYLKAQEVAETHNQQISFSGARLGTLTNHFCGVSTGNFAVSPAGNVTSCLEAHSEAVSHADKFFYGEPDLDNGGYNFDMGRLNQLRQLGVENREYCKDCFAKWTCAGDCYYKFVAQNGDIEFSGSDRCYIIQELTKNQILKRIHEAGGGFWHELPHGTIGAVQKTMIMHRVPPSCF